MMRAWFDDADALGGAGAGRQRAAHPERALIEMGQELRADGAGELRKALMPTASDAKRHHDRAMIDAPRDGVAIALR